MREHRLLAWLLSFSARRRRLVFALAGVLAIASLLIVRRIQLDADVLLLLPQHGAAVTGFRSYLEHFGSLDHVFVVFEAPPGGSVSDYGDLVGRYVEGLRRAPEVERVDAAPFEAGKDWGYLFDRELLLLGKDALPRALARFEPAGMATALARSSERLSVPSAALKQLVRADPLGLLEDLRERFAGDGSDGASLAEEGYVSPDGRGRLLIVKPTRPPFDAEFCRALLARLEGIEGAAWARFAAERATSEEEILGRPRVEIAGAYRVSLEAEEHIHREMRTNAVGSLVAILVLVFLVHRTPWILVTGAVTMGLAALLSLAIVALSGEKLLAAASGGSAMLFGLGIDGVLLLYARYVEERNLGRVGYAALPAVAATAASVLLGNITTAASFGALVLVDFPSLQELGRLVGLGMILSCALTVLMVPALLAPRSLTAGVSRTRIPGRLAPPRFGGFVERRARSILVVAAAVTVMAAIALPLLRVSTGLERLQPATAGMEVERRVRERFGLKRDVLIVLAEGPVLDPLLEANQRLAEALRPLAGSLSVRAASDLLPSRAAQERTAAAIRAYGLTPEAARGRLLDAARAAGFHDEALTPFLARIERLLDPAERLTYDGFLSHGLDEVIGRHVARTRSGFVTATYLSPAPGADLDHIARLVASAAPGLHLTGLALLSRELDRGFLPQWGKGMAIGTAAVVLLVGWSFRRVGLTLLALAPTALALLWSAGLLALAGVEVDMFSAFTVVMVVGVGVDYGIHVLHRHAVEGASIGEVLDRTGPAILLAGVTTLAGFGTLIFSSYPPLRMMGLVSVVCISASLVTSLVVFPALLALRAKR